MRIFRHVYIFIWLCEYNMCNFHFQLSRDGMPKTKQGQPSYMPNPIASSFSATISPFFGNAIDATANRNVLYIWIRGTTRHNWRRRRPKERDGIIVIKEKHRADIYTIYIRCEGYLRRKFDWYALHICEAHTHTAAGNPFCTNWQLKRKT